MNQADRLDYRSQFKKKFGFVPNVYQQPKMADKTTLELTRRHPGTEIKPDFTFPPADFDGKAFRRKEYETYKRIFDLL